MSSRPNAVIINKHVITEVGLLHSNIGGLNESKIAGARNSMLALEGASTIVAATTGSTGYALMSHHVAIYARRSDKQLEEDGKLRPLKNSPTGIIK